MGDIVARSTQPTLGAAKLAWWRDRLEQLDHAPPPAAPALRAASEHLLPLGVKGADLATLEDGWATLLDEEVDAERVAGRGARLFRLGAQILGREEDMIGDAGELYALVSVGRRGVPQLIVEAKAPARRLAGYRFPRALRPLSALARLAVRDLDQREAFESEGSPPRLAAIMRHRWSGVVTRG